MASEPMEAKRGVVLALAEIGESSLGRDWLGNHERRMHSDPEYAAVWRRRDAEAAAAKAASAAQDARVQAEGRRSGLVAAGIPEKDIDAALGESLGSTEALRTASEWLGTSESILVLAGAKGVGKTTAASWLACQVPGARFIGATKLMRVDTYDDAEMTPLERCTLLVIDDLGTEYADTKGKLSSLVDGLIDARYANRRRTVVTTNLTAAQFKLRYGERIADRIREAGRFVEFGGESLRGRR